MHTCEGIIKKAQDHNIFLYTKGLQLAYMSEAGEFPDTLKALIRENKEAIVAYLLQQEENQKNDHKVSNIPVVDRNRLLPLSFSQQGLWFVDKLEGGSSQYNIPAAFKLSGNINFRAMQGALDGLLERHEVLRTVYVEDNGDVGQRVQPITSIDLQRVDLLSYDEDKQQKILRELVTKEMSEPFDLKCDLMIRVKLVVLAEREHVLLFTMHHIASDGWSQAILVREFMMYYESLCKQVQCPLPPLEIQYADYAYWQRNYLDEKKIVKQLDFWKKRLSGAPKYHSLPLDRPRKPQQLFSGRTFAWQLDIDTTNALKQLAKTNGSTLFMVLYTAYSVFLGRWSQTRDIIIGSPIAGRTHPQVAPLIGYFINSIVYRTQWTEQQSFLSILKENRQHTLGSFDNQDIPFEALVDKLNIERELSYSPLFQLMFTLQNNEKTVLELADLTIEPLATTNAIIKYDLEMVAEELESGISFLWNYSVHLFDERTIRTMAGSFTMLLHEIAKDADVIVECVELCANHDISMSATFPDQVSDNSDLFGVVRLDTAFEICVKDYECNTAISIGEHKVRYGDLNRRANRVARYLIEQGVTVDHIVHIYLENTYHAITVMLAALKMGVSYRVFNSSQFNCANETSESFYNIKTVVAMEFGKNSENIILVNESINLESYVDENLGTRRIDESKRFIGDGCSKLDISLETAFQQVVAQQQLLDISERSVLLITPETIHYSATEWLVGLLAGAKLVLSQDVTGLSRVVTHEAITHATLTPYLLNSLNFNENYELEHIAVVDGLRCDNLLWQWSHKCMVTNILNIGPRSLVSACKVITGKTINLGRILMPAHTFLINKSGGAAPIGAIGDLYIDNVTGDSIAENDNKTMYATGLTVRRLLDNSVELMSTKKTEMTRESCLIETIISQQPYVKYVVMINNVAIIGFTESTQSPHSLLNELKMSVRKQIPSHLIPDSFMLAIELPLLLNSDVSRALLRDQFDYWRKAIKDYSRENKEEKYAVDLVQDSDFFNLEPQSIDAVVKLARKNDVSVATMFIAVFSIVLESDFIVETDGVFGLGEAKRTLFVLNSRNEECKAGVLSSTLHHLKQSIRYRYLSLEWIRDTFNGAHKANIKTLFNYKLNFGITESDLVIDEHTCILLKVQDPNSLNFGGQWFFNAATSDKNHISKLNEKINKYLLWINDNDTATLEDLKNRTAYEARNKLKSVKRKFNLRPKQE